MSTVANQSPRVVVVVGASSGIGKAAAEALAQAGQRVYGTSRDATRVASRGVTGVSLETGDEVSVRQAIETIIQAEGRIDALFYAAGFYTAGAIEETTPAQIHEQLDAYMVGAHRVTRALLPHYRKAKAGRLLFMSSNAGDSSLPYHTAYSVSKAALQAYCDGLRYEVEPFGIQVSYMQAGGVKTGAKASFRPAAEPVEAYAEFRDKAIAAFHRMQEKGPVPHYVGRAVAKAFAAEKMKPVLRIDFFSKLLHLLKVVLPAPIYRSQVLKSLGL